MTNPKVETPVPDGGSKTPAGPGPGLWLLAILAGLALAAAVLAGLLFLLRPAVENQAGPAQVEPLFLQAENLAAIEGEIARLRNGLALAPCDMPPLNLGTPFSQAESGSPGPERAAAAASDSLAERVERATVMVVVESAQGVGNGSGFFVASDLVLTNRHVVDSLVGPAERIFVTNKALGGLIPARVIRSTDPDQLRDYAFLSVALPPDSSHSVLAMSPQVKRTDRVSAWGYPILLTKADPQLGRLMDGDSKAVPEVVYSEGVVSVIQDYEGLPVINHTAEVSQGNSGGPLVNEGGQVVGVNTLIRVDEDSSRQVNIALGSGDIITFAAGLGLAPAER